MLVSVVLCWVWIEYQFFLTACSSTLTASLVNTTDARCFGGIGECLCCVVRVSVF